PDHSAEKSEEIFSGSLPSPNPQVSRSGYGASSMPKKQGVVGGQYQGNGILQIHLFGVFRGSPQIGQNESSGSNFIHSS
ncbi:MAG: hypothetical protein ACRECH_00430, partial [Nitrososphaerales archaeon]